MSGFQRNFHIFFGPKVFVSDMPNWVAYIFAFFSAQDVLKFLYLTCQIGWLIFSHFFGSRHLKIFVSDMPNWVAYIFAF